MHFTAAPALVLVTVPALASVTHLSQQLYLIQIRQACLNRIAAVFPQQGRNVLENTRKAT